MHARITLYVEIDESFATMGKGIVDDHVNDLAIALRDLAAGEDFQSLLKPGVRVGYILDSWEDDRADETK